MWIRSTPWGPPVDAEHVGRPRVRRSEGAVGGHEERPRYPQDVRRRRAEGADESLEHGGSDGSAPSGSRGCDVHESGPTGPLARRTLISTSPHKREIRVQHRKHPKWPYLTNNVRIVFFKIGTYGGGCGVG